MDTPPLKLITPDQVGEPVRARPAAPLALAALIFASAALATWLGAEPARRPIPARDLAEGALRLALERGNDDAEVRATLLALRRTLTRRPLDSRTRVVYASLLLGLARRVEETGIAAFHARRAAELAPVTVPVARSAALVLARTGHAEEASALIREMFGYDPRRAAKLLARVDRLLLGGAIDSGLPEEPRAWLSWVAQLRESGRRLEAEAWVERTYRRWPDHTPALEQMAAGAVLRRDWEALGELFPPESMLPEEPASAGSLLYRARLKAIHEERAAAMRDVESALRLNGGAFSVQLLAGDTYESLGDVAAARRMWSKALHRLAPEQSAARRRLLVRLARLEDGHGQAAAALRFWESILELDPEHAEARQRVDDLSGFRR